MKHKLSKLLIMTTAFAMLTTSCTSKRTSVAKDPETDGEVIVLEDDVQNQFDHELKEYDQFNAHTVYDDGEKIEEFKEQKQAEVIETISNNFKTYTVQRNETLMMISFKLFGVLSDWKKLYSWNEEQLINENNLTPGMQLKYVPADEEFSWQPEGNPYLIVRGDTLGVISTKVYDGEKKYWKKLWENNKPMIRDPNLIFAGFTIFYQPLEQLTGQPQTTRELSSETEVIE
ncbi:MAG: hypothetical protein COW00_14420 [Bdellovibrio sp. CG12_big_fil_rev_8_21_14_0_65_39_13]|nr:MAG: hypothetical protein COW78_07835 [Bdellovibrio sp. CG22_combo_CG10-13_8_21_14_all_39_27]PIQ58808.1 MAG: hypothetical protein COW00_14420 [Bdellovibrio sp. CG12_big_fil_rev_8_21_14_0_65_39_13]PIR35511.1 MAG: hypothetical protein COV37_08530 [Bdellovibrio sp. CG11_big_fil_rev_8_21_14_0_20_39_38]PJB54356.1 MAG: hypothetical protein CO099_02075 [Bdellovibrio sp. CG_4_9_14_3_um_filter_39_7]